DAAVLTTVPDVLDDACGDDPGWLCEWVFDVSDGNERLAQVADWFVDRPLTVLLIVIVAWLLGRLARRAVAKVVTPFVTRDRMVERSRLQRLGIENPSLLLGSEEEFRERAARAEGRAKSLSSVLGSTAAVAIWIIALFMIVGELGIQLGPLLASAGIAGVALGFGAQSLVKDCISGMFILMEDQYGIGDIVDLGEAIGEVEEVALRTTVLRGLDGTVWHVPNGEITRVGNKSQLWSVALVDVDVAYDADLDVAERTIHAAAEALCAEPDWADDIVEDPIMLGVEHLGADGITIRMVVKCSPGSQWALQRQLRQRIKVALDGAGIEIPFPQRTLWIREQPTE
ncbi:MAG: mechanosensitive ion channel family protein, partial [Actinomycetota bacterium]